MGSLQVPEGVSGTSRASWLEISGSSQLLHPSVAYACVCNVSCSRFRFSGDYFVGLFHRQKLRVLTICTRDARDAPIDATLLLFSFLVKDDRLLIIMANQRIIIN